MVCRQDRIQKVASALWFITLDTEEPKFPSTRSSLTALVLAEVESLSWLIW